MGQIVDGVHPKSHNKGSHGQLDWVQSLLINMSSNYGLSDQVQSLPRNVSSTDKRSHDYMFERHKGDQLTRGPQDKVLKRANQRR